MGSLRDREVACSASDLQGLNFESCVWRTVSSHYPQDVLLAQFSLYVHKSGMKPNSSHFCDFSLFAVTFQQTLCTDQCWLDVGPSSTFSRHLWWSTGRTEQTYSSNCLPSCHQLPLFLYMSPCLLTYNG